jgi:hypothetical protein
MAAPRIFGWKDELHRIDPSAMGLSNGHKTFLAVTAATAGIVWYVQWSEEENRNVSRRTCMHGQVPSLPFLRGKGHGERMKRRGSQAHACMQVISPHCPIVLLQRMRQGPLRDRERLEAKVKVMFQEALKDFNDDDSSPPQPPPLQQQR